MSHPIHPHARPFSFPEGDHGILLIHGFTGIPDHLRQMGEALHERGFGVRGILLPGHGTVPEDMARVSWQDWLLEVRTAAREMQASYPHFSVAGLSMGGVLALMVAQEMDVTACVPIAAAMKTTNQFRWAAPLAAPFYPMIGKKGAASRPSELSKGEGYNYYPTKSVHDLSVLMRKARRNLSLIHRPGLAVQSRRDKTVTADSPQIILDGVSSQVKAMLWLKTSPHVCTNTPEYPLIVDAMEEFLRKAEKA